MALCQAVLGLNHRKTVNYLAQVLEIWYEALPIFLYQVCSNEVPRVQNGPLPEGAWFEP